MNAKELINECSKLNVGMQADGDTIRWSAPTGVVRDELLAEMKGHKAEILFLLKAKKIGERRAEGVPSSTTRITRRGTGDFPHIYRPGRISEVYGQDETKEIIAHGLNNGTLNHVLLFHGLSGTGKTTMSRIVAMGLNCIHGPTSEPCCECGPCRAVLNRSSFAFQEFDAAHLSGVDSIRKKRDDFFCGSLGGERNTIIVFDESHRLSEEAQAALLKPTEDVPDGIYFIFCTTGKLLKTLENRCQQFEFTRLSDDGMSHLLTDVCTLENLKTDQEQIRKIITFAGGMPRNGLLLLQKLSYRAKPDVPFLNQVVLGD